MRKFEKVILSRKGFDSASGGGFSPFDPEEGKYIVLPIPMRKQELAINYPLKYEKIHTKSNHLDGCPETDLKSLMMKSLRIKKATITVKDEITGKDTKEESEYAHFDPWLIDCPWLEEDSKHQIGAFGQIGMAQAHLDKQKVGEGSLFLFFSRFKPIKNRKNKILHDVITSEQHLGGGLYFIYGWLKVKKVIKKYEELRDEDRLSRHPHATPAYFNHEDPVKNNTIYIADEFLFNDGSNIRGCGYFPKLSEDLLLTAPVQKSEKSWIPSRWKMPPGFSFQTCKSIFNKEEKWDTDYLVKTGWRWQEAVFDLGESQDFCHWFQKLHK
jgi:hypothetical protein